MFGLSIDGEIKIDPTNLADEGFQRIVAMTVLIIDEASMIDDRTLLWLRDQLSSVGAATRQHVSTVANFLGKHPEEDSFGRVHILVAMDLKQLPPATSNPPSIAGDPEFLTVFDFRVLRQNRRLVVGSSEEGQQALDTFHGVLEDVAHGRPTTRVREALVAVYARAHNKTKRPWASKAALRALPQYVTDIVGMARS